MKYWMKYWIWNIEWNIEWMTLVIRIFQKFLRNHVFKHLKVKVKVTQSCPTLCNLMNYTVHGILQAWILEWVTVPFLFPSSGDLSNPGIKPRSPTLQADSLPGEPQEKPKNTGVGSLSLLQEIFPIQESNWGLLHCRRILYQLSYEGSPFKHLENAKNILNIPYK